jgi:hypothetical protein
LLPASVAKKQLAASALQACDAAQQRCFSRTGRAKYRRNTVHWQGKFGIKRELVAGK